MYQLNDEQKMFREQLRRMVAEKVAPRAAEIDRAGEFPWDLKEVFQEMGLLGLSVPEEYGGTSQGHIYLILAVEEIARACVSSSLIVQVQSLGWEPILIGGSDDQKRVWGPRVASGEVLTAYGLTEPGAGSDAAAMHTK
ncbi:MAG TPA: acyl-CoA dehydrogenase, partial [Desulfobacteraceae bacterium]|nr:acyl-CoA dehydrogenase [Desulfobacteraceae bacterium]